MPRTKKRTTKSSSTNDMTVSSMDVNQPKNIKQILEEFDLEKNRIEDFFSVSLENHINQIENHILMVKMNLSGVLDKNLYDYIAECNNLKKPKSATTTSTTSGSNRSGEKPKPVTKKIAKHNSATGKVTTRNSAIRAGNNGPSLTVKDESKFKTPSNRPIISNSSTVTPKVNMNEPMSVMRRPNQGEVALSMTGSPLMISSVSRDDMATVSVPLSNGNILSILPRFGSAMDISFDENTKNELLLLKGNIEGLLKMNKDH